MLSVKKIKYCDEVSFRENLLNQDNCIYTIYLSFSRSKFELVFRYHDSVMIENKNLLGKLKNVSGFYITLFFLSNALQTDYS
jgi:hypothetical protein